MYDPLRRLIHHIRIHGKNSKLIFLGDYIDYGPCSKEVIELLLQLDNEFECVFLAGNHEDLLLQFKYGSDLFQDCGNMWFRGNGGQETVYSLMDDSSAVGYLDEHSDFPPEDFKIKRRHWDFLRTLKYAHSEMIDTGERKYRFVFTHSSLCHATCKDAYWQDHHRLSIGDQTALKTYKDFHTLRRDKQIWIEDLHLWNREEPHRRYGNFVLVHGHTPTTLLKRYTHELGSYDCESKLPYVHFEGETAEVLGGSYDLKFHRSLDEVISINIDTGAVYGNALTALRIDEDNLRVHQRLFVKQVHVDRRHRHREDLTYRYYYFVE